MEKMTVQRQNEEAVKADYFISVAQFS